MEETLKTFFRTCFVIEDFAHWQMEKEEFVKKPLKHEYLDVYLYNVNKTILLAINKINKGEFKSIKDGLNALPNDIYNKLYNDILNSISINKDNYILYIERLDKNNIYDEDFNQLFLFTKVLMVMLCRIAYGTDMLKF